MLIMIRCECMCCLRWWQPVAGVSGNDFWGFGNGNRKFHSQSLGTGRELKIPFPKFGNGKGMKKSIPKIREREGNEKRHSRNSGTGREWKKTFPKFGNGNQRLLFPGMDGNGNGNGTKKLRWLELIENVVKCSENKGRVPKKTRKNLSQSTIFPFDSRLWNGQFGNGKGMKNFHSQSLGTGREWKNPFPKFGNGKGMKKDIPEIREREGNEKIHSQSSGTGIRGLHSWEWPGTGIPAHPCIGYVHMGHWSTEQVHGWVLSSS